MMSSKSAVVNFRFIVAVLLGVSIRTKSFALNPLSFHPTRCDLSVTTTTQLPAVSPSARNNPNHPKPFSVPSKTACESAVIVEWEPMTELERRIEDGIHYEHIQPSRSQHHSSKDGPSQGNRAFKEKDSEEEESQPKTRAVFCGYRYSEDEYNRLKSADVSA